MPATYVNATAFVLQKAEPRIRAFELTTVTETWCGPLGTGAVNSSGKVDSSILDAFTASVAVGSQYGGGIALPGPSSTPTGYLIDISTRENGLFATVDRTVGYPPTPVNTVNSTTYLLDPGYPKKTASLSATINNSSIISGQSSIAATRKVSFYAPTTKYTYFTLSCPDGPAFSGVYGTRQPAIVGSIITAAAGGTTLTYGSGSAPLPLMSGLAMPVIDELDEFEPVQIPGTPWYKVTESWSRVLQGDKS